MLGKIMRKIKTEASLLSYRSGAQNRADDSSLAQWGIVGTGPMAERFARAISKHEGSNVRSVSSRSIKKAEEFGKRHGAVACYEGVESFALAEVGKINIAYIATPVEAHFDGVKTCLAQGINVLCEKPMCESAEQVEELYQLADSNGVLLMEGMWSYCLPTYKKAEKWLKDSSIGDVVGIDVSLKKNERNPGKSVMNDYGTYALAFAAKYAQDRLDLVKVARSDYSGYPGVDCDWKIEARTAEGVCVNIVVSAVASGNNIAAIRCKNGTISFNSQFNRTNEVVLLDRGGNVVDKATFDYVSEGYEFQIQDAVSLVRGREETGFSRNLSLETARLRSEALLFAAEVER